MKARKIGLFLSYDGREYSGWQQQRGQQSPTVAGTIEKALSKIYQLPVSLLGSGRTDAGVSARKQVAAFTEPRSVSLSPENFSYALTRMLPRSITVWKSFELPPSFHPIRDAEKRTYRYFFHNASLPPAAGSFCLPVKKLFPLPLSRLNSMASLIVGSHDFTTFTASLDQSPSKVRDIMSASFFPSSRYPEIIFEISGNGFLHTMVRSLVGTMLGLSSEEEAYNIFREKLEAQDRLACGVVAPPDSLFLWDVSYERI